MPLYTYDSILTEVQEALQQLNQGVPNGVYDVKDDNAKIMGSLINTIGPQLTDVFPWQQFRKVFTVNGDSVKRQFALPSDLSRFVDNTGWSYANRRPVIVVTAQTYAEIEVWLSQSFFINPAVRVLDDQMYFLAAPAEGEEIKFEYVTKYWVRDADGSTMKEVVNKNGDVPLFDRTLMILALKLKWAETRGMDTTRYQNEFDQRFSQLTQRNQMGGTLSLNGSMRGFRYLDGSNMPDYGYGA